MNQHEAITLLSLGKFVKLPEWQGFWFDKNGEIKVFTYDGKILDSPFLSNYEFRTDWEVTDGKRDLGGALKALKTVGSLVDHIHRDGEKNRIIKFDYFTHLFIEEIPSVRSTSDYIPTKEDLVAEDFVVFKTEWLE